VCVNEREELVVCVCERETCLTGVGSISHISHISHVSHVSFVFTSERDLSHIVSQVKDTCLLLDMRHET